jgi:predicted ABC-type exoprotein transport system permease subunit
MNFILLWCLLALVIASLTANAKHPYKNQPDCPVLWVIRSLTLSGVLVLCVFIAKHIDWVALIK